MAERHQRSKVNAYLRESALGENAIELVSDQLMNWLRNMMVMIIITMEMATEWGKVRQGACICVYHDDDDRTDCVKLCESLNRTRGQAQLSHCSPGVDLN